MSNKKIVSRVVEKLSQAPKDLTPLQLAKELNNMQARLKNFMISSNKNPNITARNMKINLDALFNLAGIVSKDDQIRAIEYFFDHGKRSVAKLNIIPILNELAELYGSDYKFLAAWEKFIKKLMKSFLWSKTGSFANKRIPKT